MRITEALKKYLVEQCGVKADATEEEFKRAASDSLVSGKLPAEKYLELVKEEDDKANQFVTEFRAIAGELRKVTELLTPKSDDGAKAKAEADAKAVEAVKAKAEA